MIIYKQGKFIIINKQDSKQACTCTTLRPMEINYLVRVSARTDFFYRAQVFHRSSQIVNFYHESAKICIWPCSSVRMGFTQQL